MPGLPTAIGSGLLANRPAASSATNGYLYVATDVGGCTLYRCDGSGWTQIAAGATIGGTVTSVGLSLPAEFSVSGSPVTGAGTLAATKATQGANQLYAGPSGGSAAAPAFRPLVSADLPSAPTVSGEVAASDFAPSGLGGATQASRYVGATTAGAPASGTYAVGDWVVTRNGHVLICTTAGAPGTWTDAGAAGSLASPLTTKGDLWGFDSANNRVPAGTNGYVLTADSTQTLGLKWAAASSTTLPAFCSFTAPPLASTWTWVNQGTATATDSSSMVALAGPAVSGDNWRLLVKSAPATPYTITAALLPYAGRTGLFGLFFRESGSGKLAYIGYGDGGTATDLQVVKFTNPTTYSAAYVTVGSGSNSVWAPTPVWLRIADNGTSRISSISGDGVTWVQIHSVGRTDFLTADQVGVGLDVNNATYTGALSLASWVAA